MLVPILAACKPPMSPTDDPDDPRPPEIEHTIDLTNSNYTIILFTAGEVPLTGCFLYEMQFCKL